MLNQTDEGVSHWDVSDEELEVVSSIGTAAPITLYHATYCFACRA